MPATTPPPPKGTIAIQVGQVLGDFQLIVRSCHRAVSHAGACGGPALAAPGPA
jgi:hypothetical protein